MPKTLPLFGSDWRFRWLYTPNCGLDGKLHRIAHVDFKTEWDWVGVRGRTACGLEGEFHMPGLLSRLARPRCANCCRIAGVPLGDGAPANANIRERGERTRKVRTAKTSRTDG